MKNKILFGLLLLALLLRAWHVSYIDLTTDDALYSFRALGWTDYLGGSQTTPLNWFEQVPTWAHLSFHDAPPLVFLIQKIFFGLFGDHSAAAKAPFVLAGILTVYLVYLICKKYVGNVAAAAAGLIMAVSSYAVWTSRTGYLEGIEILFIILSLLCWLKYFSRDKNYWLWLWGLTGGLAMLCKYTALFIWPAALLSLFWVSRDKLKQKNFWLNLGLSLIIAVAVFSPVLIYNWEVWLSRGHLDSSLSAMVGMHPADFGVVAQRAAGWHWLANFKQVSTTLIQSVSWPLLTAEIISIIYLLWKLFQRRQNFFIAFILSNLLFLVAMFLFSGVSVRFLSIVVPFLAISLGWVCEKAWLKRSNKTVKIILALLILSVVLELFYSLNTNWFSQPVGRSSLTYSGSKFTNHGWKQLETYLNQQIYPQLPAVNSPASLSDFQLDINAVKNQAVVFYDDRLDWFAYSWYLQKYPLYYQLPVLSWASQISSAGQVDPVAALKSAGAKNFYYIAAAGELVMDSVKKNDSNLTSLNQQTEDQLIKQGIKAVELKDLAGRPAFRIYQFN